jgi:hypothetical protein
MMVVVVVVVEVVVVVGVLRVSWIGLSFVP